MDYGVNFFDTADLYDKGQNEALLGKALKDRRSKVILATKVGNEWADDGKSWNWNPSKAYILKAVDKSLQRLQTDYIDLYQLHGGTIEDPIDETIEAFEILQQQGKIRYYGISSIRPNVIKEYVTRSNISSVMMQYSLLDRRPEEECIDILQKNNIGILARGTLAKGLLAGKPSMNYLDHTKGEVQHIVDELKGYLKDTISLGDASVQYVLKDNAISSAVIGIRTQKQLDECYENKDVEVFSDMDYKELRKRIKAYLYKNHR